MTMSDGAPDWSRRAPQRFFFAALAVVFTIAIAVTAVGFIQDAVGGVVPYFMLLVGSALGGFYFWNFVIRKE
jgi:hypothetical protein